MKDAISRSTSHENMGIDTKIMTVGQKLAEIYIVLSTKNNQKQVDVIQISIYAQCKINVKKMLNFHNFSKSLGCCHGYTLEDPSYFIC